ncbi:hypothetical protein ACFS07_18320 [Undibacterium arcticum]
MTHGNIYTELQAGVQIANRSSALNEIEYSELVMRLRQIADGLGAELDVPDMGEVMSAAKALYQFVSEHDAQLGVNIHSNGAPWAINTLLTALERQGFDLRPDGRFVMQDGDGGVLFFVVYQCHAGGRDHFAFDLAAGRALRRAAARRFRRDGRLCQIAGQAARWHDRRRQ